MADSEDWSDCIIMSTSIFFVGFAGSQPQLPAQLSPREIKLYAPEVLGYLQLEQVVGPGVQLNVLIRGTP